ncbi:MAG: MFS transporter [Cyanobium sp. LacPavin_0818_WC50_MAG_67_9]|nr:MFS transporter [Cyanobium sp. LacPavin_0818_WC50_MAG_67_9]
MTSALPNPAKATMAGLLGRPGFRAFWLANLVSNLGTSAFVLAINWLTVKQHGAAGIASLALAYGLPQMLLQLVGGTVSDRIDRRRLFGLTQSGLLLMALLVLIASLRGLVPLWLLALVNGANGVLAAFDTPARTALVTDLVEPEEVTLAQQLYSLTTSATNIFGPALGGVLLSLGPTARSHEEVAFAFDVFSFVPLLIAIPWLPRSTGRSAPKESFRTSLRAGLHYVRERAQLRTLLLVLSLVMVLGMPFQGLLPVFVQRHLSGETGHGFYAALMSAVGLGSFVGSLLGMELVDRWRAGLLLAASSAGLGVSVLLLSASNVVHWASLSVFLAGAFSTLAISVDNALLQAGSDRDMQGRVNAISNLTKGLQSLSLAAAGYTIHGLAGSHRFGSGYQLVQVCLALGLLAGVVALWPRLRGFKLN